MKEELTKDRLMQLLCKEISFSNSPVPRRVWRLIDAQIDHRSKVMAAYFRSSFGARRDEKCSGTGEAHHVVIGRGNERLLLVIPSSLLEALKSDRAFEEKQISLTNEILVRYLAAILMRGSGLRLIEYARQRPLFDEHLSFTIEAAYSGCSHTISAALNPAFAARVRCYSRLVAPSALQFSLLSALQVTAAVSIETSVPSLTSIAGMLPGRRIRVERLGRRRLRGALTFEGLCEPLAIQGV